MIREEAITKHRAMWNWFAEQIENEQRTMNIGTLKSVFLERQGDDTIDMRIYHRCYLCYYSAGDCENCPLLWPSESQILKCEFGYVTIYGYTKGLYNKCYMLYNSNYWQLQAKLCRKIANLPERKMSNEKH